MDLGISSSSCRPGYRLQMRKLPVNPRMVIISNEKERKKRGGQTTEKNSKGAVGEEKGNRGKHQENRAQ